jgi:gas vesicle protein
MAMASRDGNASGTVLLAFAIGALAGAAVALLYAPATGEETRRRLAQRAQAARDRAEALARDGKQFVERHRETIDEVIDRGREAFDRVKESV